MDKLDDDLGVSRVSELSRNASNLVGGEIPDGKVGCEDDELMVEVVGSDVFFDGVSGVGMGRNSELGVWGDGVEAAGSASVKVVVSEGVVEEVGVVAKEGGVEVDVKLKGIAGSSGDKVVVKDVVMEEVGIVAKEGVVQEDVKVVVSEGGLEKGEEVNERDGVSCVLATPSVNEDSDMLGDAMNCDTKVVEEEDSMKCEEVTERDGVRCEMATLSAGEDIDMHGDAINCASEVVEEDVKVAANEDALGRGENVIERDDVSSKLPTTSAQEDNGLTGEAVNGAGETLVVDTAKRTGLIEGVIEEDVKVASSEGGERGEEVTVRDDVSCVLATPSACKDSDMDGDAMNFDTKVVEEDVKIVVEEDSMKCEEVTERDGVRCEIAALSAGEDIDMHGDAINCASEVVKEDVKVAANEDALGRGENVIERDDLSSKLPTSSTQEDNGLTGEAVNGAGETLVVDTAKKTGLIEGVIEEDVKVAVSEGGERGVVTVRDDVSCVLATPSACKDSDMDGDAMNFDTKVVEEDVKVVVEEDSMKCEEVTERDGVRCEMAALSAGEDIDMHGDAINCASEVVKEDVKVAANEDALGRGENVIERDDVSSKLPTSSTQEDNGLTGEAVNGAGETLVVDTAKKTGLIEGVIEEDVKVALSEGGERGEEVTVRDDVSCVLATPSACKDSDMDGDAMNFDTKVAEQDVKVVANEDYRKCEEVTERNVIARDDVRCGLATSSVHELIGIHGVAINGADEVSAGDKLVCTESYNKDTSDVAENLPSVDDEDGAEEVVKPLGEVLENQMLPEIGLAGGEASNAHVLDDIDTSDKSVETATRTGLIDGDCDINEGAQTSIDLVPTIEHSGIVAGFTEEFDSKVVNSNRDVKSRDHNILTTGSEGMLVENADCAGEKELKVEAFHGSSRSDIALCSDLKSGDTGKHVEQVNIPEADISGVSFKVAIDSKDNGSVVDALNHTLSSCVERVTFDSNTEVSTTVMDVISGVEDIQGMKCDPSKKDDVPMNEENVDKQAIDFIGSNVQETKGDFDMPVQECLDATSTGKFVRVTSDQDHIVEVEEDYNDLQETDVLDKAMDVDQSDDYDEKISEQMSPGDESLYSDCHSHYLLPPKNEGEFAASDLVWGKVRSHPWWPGQICDPSDASEKAMKYHKKDCFLVSYFGDRTFAWNDASWLRPFRTHFSQIKGQSNSEAFHHAVGCALAEVSRRVELGLACSCIPKNSFAEIESQILENAGICQEAGIRYGVDESSAASCFEPGELLEHIKSLAVFPSADSDVLLQLVISKAQLSALSRFKGQAPLPEFQLCGGLLEKDANTDGIQQHGEEIKGENNVSSKRNHDFADSLPPRKKERSLSDLMEDKPHSSDGGEDEIDSNVKDKSFASSAGIKRKAVDSLTDGSDKRQNYYAAKVSTTASQTPKPSFKIGECIRRVASQLTASPSLVKSNSEKFLKVDDSVEQHIGIEDDLQTPVNSQKEPMMLSPEHSSLAEILSQLHLAAQDPMKGYSFLKNITSFFTGFRHSVASGQSSRTRNSSTGRGGRKKKAPQSIMNSPEDFEFDDVNDSYWTDRIVQNYGEDELLNNAQNGEAEHHLVLHLADKPVKSSRRSRKQFSNGENLIVAEEPITEPIDRKQDCSPTELILNFSVGHSLPTELNLNKIFRRFGPLRECETEVDRESRRARVVYKRSSDAEVALSSAGNFNIFGPMHVSYELSYVPSAPYKPLPVAALEGELNASSFI